MKAKLNFTSDIGDCYTYFFKLAHRRKQREDCMKNLHAGDPVKVVGELTTCNEHSVYLG